MELIIGGAVIGAIGGKLVKECRGHKNAEARQAASRPTQTKKRTVSPLPKLNDPGYITVKVGWSSAKPMCTCCLK
jgi:hypothetical protein